MKSIILVRHGESLWNREGRLTGWTDVGLTPLGEIEARSAAERLIINGYKPDKVYCSYLERSYRTLEIMLDIYNLKDLTIKRCWQLNENHYGQLQGMRREDVYKIYGREKADLWLSSYNCAPPALEHYDKRNPSNDPKYANISAESLPLTESYSDLSARVLNCWNEQILPNLDNHDCIMVVAHGNSLREIIKDWFRIGETNIFRINLASASPLILNIN